MDPLSISLGVVTLITAAGQVIKGAEKLQNVLRANNQVCALINELTDLKCVLSMANANQEHLSSARIADLRVIIRRARDKLSELEHIINHRILKSSSPQKETTVDRLAWAREKAKIELIQKEVRQITSAFSLALNASISGGVDRVELALTELTALTHHSKIAQRSFHDSTEMRLTELYEAVKSLHVRSADDQPEESSPSTTIPQEPPPDYDLEQGSKALELIKPDSTTAKQQPVVGYVRVRTSRAYSGNECYGQCCCCCHARQRTRSPSTLDGVLGVLFMGYTGFPISLPTCNIRTCRSQRGFSAQLTYYFPWWFVARAVVTSLSLGKPQGPEFTLRMPRVVPETAPIFSLVRAGNIDGIKYLFQNGLASPFDIGGAMGATPLHVAIDPQHNLEAIKFLIDAGAEGEAPDKTQRTAADRIWDRILGKGDDYETQRRYIELFSSTTRIEQLQRRQFSHLHSLVLDQVPGDLQLELKIPSGINAINTVDADGYTPLTWASRRGDKATVVTLLEHGADATIPTNSGATALYYAGLTKNSDGPAIIRALLKAGADPNAANFRGQTPLVVCTHHHDEPEEYLAPLVSYGADVNACDRQGATILDGAILTDHVDNAAFLMEAGAIIDSQNGSKTVGVYAAVMCNSHRVLRLLLNSGADAGGTSKDQKTLLHLAAANGDCETFDTLAAYGLDIDREARDSSGETAEEIFDKREGKEQDLIDGFERLLESLGSGSVVFGDLDGKELKMRKELLEVRHSDSSSPTDDYIDAEEELGVDRWQA